ncbi:hypothetical protein ACFW5X_14445 [Streptomyces albogriseolus]|uniref:hypothetical protein n=1 Tax=Streptomyces TaxID=1883 RepID=UPI002A74AD38|nr:hypothetical protein [Streptomyces sp. CL7]WPP34477.1 hypothetical protein SJH97_34625 [Streptomyces sp. CL7]
MASRRKGSPDPTKPLVRQVRSVGPVDARALVGELRQFHEEAEDPGIERMPADEEIYGALLYAEKRAGSLRALPAEKQKAAALIRVLLWEFLSERLRVHQSTAIDDARSAGAEWRELAPALAVGAPSAAYNKARRLQAGSLSDAVPGTGRVRRTPEAVRQAERRIAEHRAAEERAQAAARQRHHLLAGAAQRLLDQQGALVMDEDVEYWLGEVAEVLPHCTTPTQMLGLSRYLSAALRALRRLEHRTGQPSARTHEAHAACAAVASALAE